MFYAYRLCSYSERNVPRRRYVHVYDAHVLLRQVLYTTQDVRIKFLCLC